MKRMKKNGIRVGSSSEGHGEGAAEKEQRNAMYSASVRPSRAAAQRRLRSDGTAERGTEYVQYSRRRVAEKAAWWRGRTTGHATPRARVRRRRRRRSEEGAALEQPRRGVSRVVQAALRHGALRVALLLLLRVRVRVERRVARRLAHASQRRRHARRDGGKLRCLRRHILRASRCSGGSASAQDEHVRNVAAPRARGGKAASRGAARPQRRFDASPSGLMAVRV
jgi:hypothetical protein